MISLRLAAAIVDQCESMLQGFLQLITTSTIYHTCCEYVLQDHSLQTSRPTQTFCPFKQMIHCLLLSFEALGNSVSERETLEIIIRRPIRYSAHFNLLRRSVRA